MTPDPYRAGTNGSDPANPQSWNKYAFVQNDPINYRDSTGLCRDPSEGDGGESSSYEGDWFGLDIAYGGFGGGAWPSWIFQLAENQRDAARAKAAHITPLIAPGATQNQQQALKAGIETAWAHIVSNANCMSFLTGNSAETYLTAVTGLGSILSNTTYSFAPLLGGTAAQTFSVNQVTINTSGSFFSPPTLGNAVFVRMPNSQGQQALVGFSSVSQLDAFILLHELGHQTDVLPADENDAQNGTNSADILTNCFTQNGGLYQ